jgi:hypothetical protein
MGVRPSMMPVPGYRCHLPSSPWPVPGGYGAFPAPLSDGVGLEPRPAASGG